MTKHRFDDGERIHEVDVESTSDGTQSPSRSEQFEIRLADGSHNSSISVCGSSAEGYTVLVDGRVFESDAQWDESRLVVRVGSRRFAFQKEADRLSASSSASQSGESRVRAPMPGKVVKILVESGASVERGQGILLFEAMKMQNEVKSPIQGIVKSIAVEQGQAVESKEELFIVHAP